MKYFSHNLHEKCSCVQKTKLIWNKTTVPVDIAAGQHEDRLTLAPLLVVVSPSLTRILGRMFNHLFPTSIFFFFFLSGDQLTHTNSTFYARISTVTQRAEAASSAATNKTLWYSSLHSPAESSFQYILNCLKCFYFPCFDQRTHFYFHPLH